MGEIVHTSRIKIVREKGPTRRAMIEGFNEPVYYGVHGGIKRFYKVEPEKEHAATLDHIVAATAGWMMGTLARFLAERKIPTPEELYWADVEGDIENVNNVLKITQIRVKYHLKVSQEKTKEVKDAFSTYLTHCPAAQSVVGCIQLKDDIVIEGTGWKEKEMARMGSLILDTNDRFPELELKIVSGETLKLPHAAGPGYGVILFYRGHWWPYCRQQLADFQALKQELEAEQISVIAGSVDEKEKGKEIVDKIGITYPVAYGLSFEEVSRITGAFYEKERKILHATGFLIRPDKTIAVASYSSGPIGRLVARDVLNLVRFYRKR